MPLFGSAQKFGTWNRLDHRPLVVHARDERAALERAVHPPPCAERDDQRGARERHLEPRPRDAAAILEADVVLEVVTQ